MEIAPRTILRVAALCVTLVHAAAATAATLHVEIYGVDSGGCGPAAPCRSISRAITNAAGGDTIVVGPGLYGLDLDDDGIVNEPGEETSSNIAVNKPLTVISSHGASVTLIRWANAVAINLVATGVTFGKRNKGFTVSVRDGAWGILATSPDATIAGNVIRVVPGTPATQLTEAFRLGGGAVSAVVRDNRVIGDLNSNQANQSVIAVNLLSPSGVDLSRNAVAVSSAAVTGGTSGDVTGNVLIANETAVDLTTVGAFMQNMLAGSFDRGVFLATGASFGVFEKNTFTANGYDSYANCGVVNDGVATVNLANNFWGVPTGPGPDPADQACGLATTTPFRTADAVPLLRPLR